MSEINRIKKILIKDDVQTDGLNLKDMHTLYQNIKLERRLTGYEVLNPKLKTKTYEKLELNDKLYRAYSEYRAETQKTESTCDAKMSLELLGTFNDPLNINKKIERVIMHFSNKELNFKSKKSNQRIEHYIQICPDDDNYANTLLDFVIRVCLTGSRYEVFVVVPFDLAKKNAKDFISRIDSDQYLYSFPNLILINEIKQIDEYMESIKIKIINCHWRTNRSQQTFFMSDYCEPKHIDTYVISDYALFQTPNYNPTIPDQCKGKQYKLFMYSIPDVEAEKSDQVEDKWWYKIITNSPSCSKGKILQLQNTCWFNSILNGILLGRGLKNLLFTKLHDKYKTDQLEGLDKLLDTHLQGDSCPINVNELLYAVIKRAFERNDHIVIDELQYTKLNAKQQNIIRNMSNAVKYSKQKQPENKLGKPEFNIYDGLERILKSLFEKGQYFMYTFTSMYIDSLKDELTKQKEKPEVLVLCWLSKGYERFKIHQKIEDYELDFAILHGVGVSDSESNHSICGFICNGEPYVYDSNNVFAKSDWINHDLTEYYEKCIELDIVYGFEFLPAFVVYTRVKHTGGASSSKFKKTTLKHKGKDGVERVIYIKGKTHYVKRRNQTGKYNYTKIGNKVMHIQ